MNIAIIVIAEVILFIFAFINEYLISICFICLSVEIIYTLFCVYLSIFKIYFNTNTSKLMGEYVNNYLKQYLQVAKRLNVVSEEDVNLYIILTKEINDIDLKFYVAFGRAKK